MGIMSSNQDASNIVTFIGAEAYFQGVITAKGSLRIDGKLEGSVSDGQSVTVGESGRVQGDISAETIIVIGEVHGNLTASTKVEILAKGRVLGDVRTPKIIVEDGAVFEGNCSMQGKSAAGVKTAPKLQPVESK